MIPTLRGRAQFCSTMCFQCEQCQECRRAMAREEILEQAAYRNEHRVGDRVNFVKPALVLATTR